MNDQQVTFFRKRSYTECMINKLPYFKKELYRANYKKFRFITDRDRYDQQNASSSTAD